jgi:hypothetical protein
MLVGALWGVFLGTVPGAAQDERDDRRYTLKWRAGVEGCTSDNGDLLVRVRLRGVLTNSTDSTLIVSRALHVGRVTVTTDLVSTRPLAEHEEMGDASWPADASSEQPPDAKSFMILRSGSRFEVNAYTTLLLQPKIGQAPWHLNRSLRVRLSGSYSWHSDTRLLDRDQAGRWRDLGDLVYGDGATSWLPLNLPPRENCSPRR